MSSQTWIYSGGYDAIDLRLPSGRWISVARGDSVDVLPNEAKALKKLPGWDRAPEASTSLEGD